MPETHHEPAVSERPEPPITLSHLFRVLRAYLPVILISLAAVVVGYLLVAVTVYVLVPSQRVTTLSFRLEFEGAERGEYPNGTKFSSAEILSTPVLLKVYKNNDLSRFTTFTKFANSMFVLESNAAQEALARDYQARLSDPRLTSVDRERIQREYELKLESLSKDQYALHYLHKGRRDVIPNVLIRKVLHDTLKEWTQFAANEKHVLLVRVPVLSPDMVQTSRIEDGNPVMAAEILRAKILRIMSNIHQLRLLPAAELIRSKTEALSLNDIQIRLDDIVRFRLEPLVHSISASGFDDRINTIRFLETQLAYDERLLNAQKQIAEASQKTMMMYSNGRIDEPGRTIDGRTPAAQREDNNATRPETVMPQLSETFIDRLIQITSRSADHDFRQKFAQEYRREAVAVVPLEQAVSYDRAVLDLVRRGGAGGNITREAVESQINATREEVRRLVVEIREIYESLSANLNPSTALMTVTGSTSRVERTISIKRLGLYGLLTMLLSLPVIIFSCLIHNRVREEEESEEA
ncbi:MAG TPA: hypothetical protein VEK79_13680 [Thermoanaerobaculia bacterium]|nr:hypothetical protein [Thermoanaerobaculia bacterium]